MKKRPNATPSGPAGHSRQAFQGGTYSLMLTAAVLALLIVLNLLVSALPTNLTQYDISASKLYSVTSNTKVVVNALEQDVTIYWIVQSGEEDAVIENLLGKYESLSDHITVVKKNPDVYPTFAEQYTDETVKTTAWWWSAGSAAGLSPTTISICPSRTCTPTPTTPPLTARAPSPRPSTMWSTPSSPSSTGWRATARASCPPPSRISWRRRTWSCTTSPLLTVDAIPEDAACLLIYAPTSDISGEERDMLADYVTGGGKLLVMAGPVDGASLDNLYSLLSKYGVTANEGIVIESDREHYAFQAPFALLPDLASSAITDSPDRRALLPHPAPLSGPHRGEGHQRRHSHPLLTTSDASYSKLAGYELDTYDKEEGIWTAPSPWRSPWEAGSGQMVWFSSSAFLDDKYNALSSGANVNLGMNALSSPGGGERGHGHPQQVPELQLPDHQRVHLLPAEGAHDRHRTPGLPGRRHRRGRKEKEDAE